MSPSIAETVFFRKIIPAVFFLQLAFVPQLAARAHWGAPFLRHPSPSPDGKYIAFSYAGDIWVAPTKGGTARRITVHTAYDAYPVWSPRGDLIAFSSNRSGQDDIFVVDTLGSAPVQLTFHESPERPVDWTPDGKEVIFLARREFSPWRIPTPYRVPADGSRMPSKLWPVVASDVRISPDGGLYAFTRGYLRWYRKGFRGSGNTDIWLYEPSSGTYRQLTALDTHQHTPMWSADGKYLYYVSEEDGTANIYRRSLDTPPEERGQALTAYSEDGVRWVRASADCSIVAFERGTDIYLLPTEGNQEPRLLEVKLPGDSHGNRIKWKTLTKGAESFAISPDESQAAVVVRGELFCIENVKEGFTQPITRSAARESSPQWMPDSVRLLFVSDSAGNRDIYLVESADTSTTKLYRAHKFNFTRLTDDPSEEHSPLPSPDGKKIAYVRGRGDLMLMDADGKNKKLLVAGWDRPIFTWSPDSRWLAYIELADNLFSQIKIYDSQSGKIHALTDNRVNSYNPSWSPDGKWLYFLSQRNLHTVVPSPWGDYQPEPFLDKTVKIYMVALEPGVRSPFLPDDELTRAEKQQKKKQQTKKSKKEKKKEKNIQVKIDFNGIQQRVIPVPLPAANYSGLAVNDGFLFWMEIDRTAHNKRTLKALKIRNKDIEAKKLLDGVKGFELSADGKKLLVRQKASLFVIDAKDNPPAKLSANKVNLNGWTYSLHPENEWRQMLIDAWRMERDYFYDPHLHGLNYKKVIQKYLPYVQRVTDRDELNDLIGQMVGELSALHTFVVGGDVRRNETKISQGFLGAVLKRDPQNKGYRIAHIYRTDPNFPERLSPLVKPEVNIPEGDVIQMVNGVPVLSVDDIAVLLKNQAGKQVLLGLYSPKEKKVYNKLVKPMNARQEADLRYSEWEYTRRLLVEKEGQGKLGYVHLRAMGGGNYREWLENFYPVFNRQGLIIDVRHNRGGNIDSWILEKLLRKIWFYWKPRVGKPTWNMQYAFPGHMVVLCDQFTASDGEAFSEGFRRLGLGKVIGMRTWGGEIWLSFSNRLVDMGIASAAETGVYGPEGKWLIEGHGVDPDMVVDNLPHATFEGKDAQLEAAIRYLQKKIKEEPVVIPPPPPPYPDKTLKK